LPNFTIKKVKKHFQTNKTCFIKISSDRNTHQSLTDRND
jgi:hypothetical protein